MNRLRALAEVVMLYGLLGWAYVAVYAAAFPNELDHPIAAVLPLRRDTFGVLAFAASAVSATVLRARSGRLWAGGDRADRRRGWSRAILHTVVGYGLAAWAYLCVNSLTHPWTIGMRLTHFSPWPTEGGTAVASFAGSALALYLLRSTGQPTAERAGADA